MTKIGTLRAGFALAAIVFAVGAQAAFPDKKVTLVVGFAAGGFADTLGRAVGQKLADKWGQAVVVENRAGAGGNTAARGVTTADADGYTILVTTTALAINATLYRKLDFKVDALVPAAIPGSSAETFAVPLDRPGTLKEFLEYAKTKPITFSTAGVGSGSHLAAEYFFRNVAKVKASHVPFRGGALAVQAALGGQVDMVSTSFGAPPHIEAGKLKGLVVLGEKRSPRMPNVPTMAEAGFPDYVAASWVGFFVPAKTDKGIIEKLNADINAVVHADEAHLTKVGYTLAIRSAADTAAYFRSELSKWGEKVRSLGVSVK